MAQDNNKDNDKDNANIIAGVLVTFVFLAIAAFYCAIFFVSFVFVENFIMPENSNMVVTVAVTLGLLLIARFIINLVKKSASQFVRKEQ